MDTLIVAAGYGVRLRPLILTAPRILRGVCGTKLVKGKLT